MNTFKLNIITPEKVKYEAEVHNLLVPGSEGKFGVYAGHIPFLAPIKSGELEVNFAEEKPRFFAVHEGFVEVLRDTVNIVVSKAEESTEIDLKWANENKENSETELKKADHHPDSFEELKSHLIRAITRISIYEKRIQED